MSDSDDVALGPVYTWADARRRGARRRQISADGSRISRGLYLSSAVEPSLLERCTAWSELLPAGAGFGLETAAELYGLPTRRSSDVHVVSRPLTVLPQRRGLRMHIRQLADEDIVPMGSLLITSAAQTFLDMAARCPAAELVVIGDALMRTRRLTRETLASRLARADRVRGVVRARECAPLLTPLAMSRPESLMRYWLTTSELPEPEVQIPIHDRWGQEVAHADLGYSRWKLALEYEGRQHADRDQFGRDVDRYSLMAADGWLVLRFAARHVNGPLVVLDRTRRALLNRGWRPDA
ncbi:hypothetical protein [Candidatus Blastococcus massiliensis]|uniref:hypothetical protein n=1 Tax=Candidatus Blastococcus massiliensis TaxID=1470358 RepID=UPI0004B4A4C5|nr:hypothetical protein [Candidatus Blastococcus massiliensis]